MTKVVREAQGLGQIFVEAERTGDRPPDLRDFEAVRQADAIMIAVGRDEHLGLVAKTAEGDRVDQPVAVALEDVAGAAGAVAVLWVQPAARPRGIGGDKRWKRHSTASGAIRSAWELVKFDASMPTEAKSPARISASERPRNGPTRRRAPREPRAT